MNGLDEFNQFSLLLRVSSCSMTKQYAIIITLEWQYCTTNRLVIVDSSRHEGIEKEVVDGRTATSSDRPTCDMAVDISEQAHN